MRDGRRTLDIVTINQAIEGMSGINLELFAGKVQKIVHVHLYDKSRNCFSIFHRSCGRPSPISGKIETGESPEVTSVREVWEETGIIIEYVYSTNHFFNGTSPKGKAIYGITCFAHLPENISSESFTFNDEISGFLWASPNDALRLLAKQTDFQEGYHGLIFLLKHRFIDRSLPKPFTQTRIGIAIEKLSSEGIFEV